MDTILPVIGAVSGLLAIVGVVGMWYYWKGQVDATVGAWRKDCEKYPPAEIWMMCTTMWRVFIDDTLHKRPDLAETRSPYRLKDKGKDMIPDTIKKKLDEIPINPGTNEDVANGWLAVKFVGLNHISDMAKGNGLSVQEAVAVLSTYLDERFRGDHVGRC